MVKVIPIYSDVISEIDTLRSALKDLRPVWEKAGRIARQSFDKNFKAGGRPDAWAPLSPNTIASKAFYGDRMNWPYAPKNVTGGNKSRVRRLQQNGNRSVMNILIANGNLRDSYVQLGRKGHIHRVSEEGVEEGSSHFLAPFHEFGTNPYLIRPKRAIRLSFITALGRVHAMVVNHPGLKARPTAIIQPEDEEAVLDILLDHITGAA